MSLGPVKISATTLMMLFVPIFGAIIFKYHGGDAFSILRCIVWMIVPSIIAFRLPSLFTAGIMMPIYKIYNSFEQKDDAEEDLSRVLF